MEDDATRTYYTHECTGRLVRWDFEHEGLEKEYVVLFLPPALDAALRFDRGGKLRIEGEMEDVAVNLALLPARGRTHYVYVGSALRKQLGVAVGDEVTLRFKVAAADEVVVPEELAAVLRASPRLAASWDALTPGKQRGLAYVVGKAKSAAVRERRAREVLEELGEPIAGAPRRPR